MRIERETASRSSGSAMLTLALLGASTAVLATTFGTGAANLKPVAAQVAAAVFTAAVVIAVVPLALVRSRGRPQRAPRVWSYGEFLALDLALLSAGTASVHFAVISQHFAEWWGFGAFFVVAAIAQLTWAVLAVHRPSVRLFWIGAVGNLSIILMWALAHSAGLPFGPEPWRPESVGLADIVATSLEVLIVVGATLLAVRVAPLSERRAGKVAHAVWLVGCATTVLVALSLLSAVGAAKGLVPPSG